MSTAPILNGKRPRKRTPSETACPLGQKTTDPRISGHVDGIGMHALLGTLVRRDGLQRSGLALHE